MMVMTVVVTVMAVASLPLATCLRLKGLIRGLRSTYLEQKIANRLRSGLRNMLETTTHLEGFDLVQDT
jgi:hypothetical protein